MVATRQLKRVDSDRWVYRTPKGDYGPVTTDGVLTAILERKVDLSTQVSVLGTNKWAPAGEFALFRDHYQVCKARWDREALDAETDAVGRRIELKRKATHHAWLLIAIGVLVGLGGTAWVVWRLSLASPTGFAQLAILPELNKLPTVVRAMQAPRLLPQPAERKVARLAEPESYDTAGVVVGEETADHVTQMHFDESGEVQAISQAELARVVASAREGLHGCAREAALRTASFRGTEVGFTVAPARIVKISVGADARNNPSFQACVKATLARVQVPSFAGSERRVTVPLRIER